MALANESVRRDHEELEQGTVRVKLRVQDPAPSAPRPML